METFLSFSLPESPRILDIGCGRGGLLSKVVEFTNGKGLGVDLPDSLASELTADAVRLVNDGRIKLILKDATEFSGEHLSKEKFDIILCVGSSHAFGGTEPAIRQMKQFLRQNGIMVVGELIWAKKPSREFLDFLGCEECAYPYANQVESYF